jgi:hypothetical protein
VAILFGLNGISVAKNKNIKKLTGFLYGFSMGPFGLIIVALLSPHNNSHFDSYKKLEDSQKNLNNDVYKLYLVQKYKIEKNEILDSFVCEGHLFKSRDEVMNFAHDKQQKIEHWVEY